MDVLLALGQPPLAGLVARRLVEANPPLLDGVNRRALENVAVYGELRPLLPVALPAYAMGPVPPR